MATRQSTKVALASSQPKGTRVGLVADFGVFSVGAGLSLSAGDVIQMVRVPKGASLVHFNLTGGSGADVSCNLGDGDDVDRYLANFNQSASAPVRTVGLHSGNIPYVYSVDDTIDIAVSTVSAMTITGGFHLTCIFSMNPL